MQYECGADHGTTTPEPKRIDRCLVASCPSPRLVASGEGSRAENERLFDIYRREDEACAPSTCAPS